VVGGWLEGKGNRSNRIGALLIGVHSEPGGPLLYAGRVGTGFSDAELQRLAGVLAPLARDSTPFTGGGPPKGAHWVEPDLVVEVRYTEWTSDHRVRHPAYLGSRDDRDPSEVVREGPMRDPGGG
jgi:bifunctional non-homologous end joining protein LigD